jgi:UDP-N-acetyl-2-amino-2-deoxyglucuronate dehydrogenase
MMQRLGLAIIGCGLISKFHLKALAGVPAFKVVGVWDIIPEKANELAQENGIRPFRALEDLLVDPEIDVVDICLPSGLHAEYGCLAAAAGKHVIVEKPIDITVEAVEKLLATAKKNGVFVAGIFQNRFSPAAVIIKQALDENRLGRLIAGEAEIKWFRNEDYYALGKWKGTKKLDGGGALINQSIHMIDLLLWFLGEAKQLTSIVKTAYHQIEVEDLAMILVEFTNGALATITAATALKPGFPERIELYGEKGSIVLEAGKIVRWKVEGCREEDYLDPVSRYNGSSDPAGISEELHQIQFTKIAQAILKGEQPPVEGVDALRTLQFILSVYEANHHWVKLT